MSGPTARTASAVTATPKAASEANPPAPATALQTSAFEQPPGSFGVYNGRPEIDPFPYAPEQADGWGSLDYGGHTSHQIALTAAPGESAAQALARRKAPKPQIPPSAKLVFSVQYSGTSRNLSSLVVDASPFLAAQDVAFCDVVERPRLELALDSDAVARTSEPWLHLRFQPSATARLRSYVGSSSPTLQVMMWVALGDEVIDSLILSPEHAAEIPDSVYVRIPAPDAVQARAKGAHVCTAIKGAMAKE